jgi:hypothetical protein
MNDFLVTYLDTIDERLLQFLDEDDEFSLALVMRLRKVTTGLLDGEVTPTKVAGDWPDYFVLTGAFVAAYGSKELEVLGRAASFPRGVEDADVRLSEDDRKYLLALELELDSYPEMRRR